ncbi:restriction endonuclease subunit S [Winogradskyella arenosi]|uniref:Restriction endonuclease S subunit n=1 Tax=Winogradskyella arenosi TaxID=533325 RepID=A0A368ZG40_9FLAO|nr:restriction endonuclease subunit S [Winogradskyella arenosi]RCW92413.1 restriction endonuclease S subunit [Winogradskyella arenosi]
MSERIETELGLLPKDWNLVPLGDLLYIKGRIGWKGLKKSEYIQEGYAIINGEQIKNDEVNWATVGRIPKERYDESPEIMLQQDDILMTKDGTIGKIAYVDKLPEPATVASGVFVIRQNSEKLNQRYLYNYFRSHFFKHLIKSRTEGSVIPHLYQRDFKEMLIPLPKPKEQETIADTLFSISRKIKNLESTNETLYNLANIIFEENIKLDNESDNSISTEIGLIPSNWQVVKLIDCLTILIDNRGKTPVYVEEGIPALSAKFVKGGEIIRQHQMNYVSHELWEASEKLQEKDIIMTSEAPLGELYFVLGNTNYYPAQRVYTLRTDKAILPPEYLYLWLNSRYGKYLVSRRGSGSTVQGIKQSELKLVEVLIPDEKTIERLTPIFQDIFKKRQINFDEIKTLKHLRKTLLPRLLSGEIRLD